MLESRRRLQLQHWYGFPDFHRAARCKGFSETATPGWWSFIGAQDNRVPLQPRLPDLLRPEAQAGTGSLVRGRPLRSQHRRTAASKPPTCSRSPSASSGTTPARAGPGTSSRTGATRLSGNASSPAGKVAKMIEGHWDGVAAHCAVENKAALGCVAALKNKVRVIQRRAYGLRDEEYLRLKILSCMLPAP